MVVQQDVLAKTYADKSDDELLKLHVTGKINTMSVEYEILHSEITKRGLLNVDKPNEAKESADIDLSYSKKLEDQPVDINIRHPKIDYTNYTATKILASLIILLGWVTVIIGFFLAFLTFKESSNWGTSKALLMSSPMIGIAISGLVCIVIGQLLRATIDTADNTRKIFNHLTKGNN